MSILVQLADRLKEGDDEAVVALTQQALDEGFSPSEIINGGLLKGMMELGELFKNNEVYVPEVLVAAHALHQGLFVVKPLLAAEDATSAGRVLIATVKGDLHDIGKNLVAMMLEGNGFEVLDIGIDIAKEVIVEKVREEKPDLVALSALLTTTMPYMKEVITALQDAGLDVKVMVGGAPVTQSFADTIGAHGYATDAVRAAELAKKLLQ